MIKTINFFTQIIIIAILFQNIIFCETLEDKYKKAIELGKQRDYIASSKLLHEIISDSENTENKNLVLDSYVSLGFINLQQENFINALKYYSEGIKLLEIYEVKNYKNLDYLYKQYAHTNNILGNHITALEYIRKAQILAKHKEQYKTYYDLKISEITSLMYLGYNQESLKKLYDIETEVLSMNDNENITVLYLNIIDCNLKLKNLNIATKYLEIVQKTLKYSNDLDFKFNYELLKVQKYLVANDTLSYIKEIRKVELNDWGNYNNNNLKFEEFKILQNYNIDEIKIDELLSLKTYFDSIEDKATVIEIYKIILLKNNNIIYLKSYLVENQKYLTKTSNYLAKSLMLNDKLNNDLMQIHNKNIHLKYKNEILLLIIGIIIIIIISCIMGVYFTTKNQKIDFVLKEFQEKNIFLKIQLSSMIINLQIHIFSNEILSKEFLLDSINKLINYQKSIKEK